MVSEVPDISPFLDALPLDDQDSFLSHNFALLEIAESGLIPQEILPALEETMRQLIGELSRVSATSLRPDEIFLLSQITNAVEDIVMTGLQGYHTAARETEGVFVMDLNMTPISAADAQREDTVAMQDHIWSFIREHPEYPVCSQVLLDWVHTIQASDQTTHSSFVDYQKAKTIFYEKFENMNKTAPTTDSTVDVARAASIIREMIARRGDDNPIRSVLMAGSGNMDRFEGPLLRLLQAEGIQFDRVAAVDRDDYRTHIDAAHHDLHVDFRQGDILDPAVFGHEQFDVVMFPWSVLCDILPRRDFIKALHTAASQMRPGGILITDQAVPIGTSSYKRMQDEQAIQTGERGVFSRSFDGPDGQQLWSTFNIMNVTTFLRDAAQAGFIPCNMPETVQGQQGVVEQIETDESVIVEQAKQRTNLNAMETPIYHANGWNRMTIVLQYVGQEEALKRAHTGTSLFHTFSRLAMGEAKDGP